MEIVLTIPDNVGSLPPKDQESAILKAYWQRKEIEKQEIEEDVRAYDQANADKSGYVSWEDAKTELGEMD